MTTRIGIDARMIKNQNMHGIARYVINLLNCFANLPLDLEVDILCTHNTPLNARSWPQNFSLVPVNSPWISVKEQIELPKILKQRKISLFHATSFVAPMFSPCPMVITIHDLNHMVLPQFYTKIHQLYYHFFVSPCIKRSKHVLTVSEFSKNEIVRTLKVAPEKISAIYNGVSEDYKTIKDTTFLEYVRELYDLPSKFIFCLANNKPHKNLKQLVKAFCSANINIPIVLASSVDVELINIASVYGKKHLLNFVRFIQEEHLPAIYSMTHLFVFPSSYEGFGLPPLEALACGTPSVVSRSSSLPEVVGEANAIFADPFDYKDIARCLEIGCYDENLRDKLRTQGPARAKQFVWQNMALKTLDVYEKCLEQSPRELLLHRSVS